MVRRVLCVCVCVRNCMRRMRHQTNSTNQSPTFHPSPGTFEETPLVFVIDHIEAFAPSSFSSVGHQGPSGTHRKQLLLYSLMDLQHRSDLRFVVLGLSSECVRALGRGGGGGASFMWF